jgi:hypothetical protein
MLTVRRYQIVEDDDASNSTIFYNLKELVVSSIDLTIVDNQINGMIFVLSFDSITNNQYNIEGMEDAFICRAENFCPFTAHGVPCTIFHGIRCIQQGCHKILNSTRLGQALKATHKISLHRIAWNFFTEHLCTPTTRLMVRTGSRTEKVMMVDLMKKSMRFRIQIESIVLTSQEEMHRMQSIFGRYAIIGSRARFPKVDRNPEPIRFGTMLNKATKITLEYIPKYCILSLKINYTTISANNGIQW